MSKQSLQKYGLWKKLGFVISMIIYGNMLNQQVSLASFIFIVKQWTWTTNLNPT
jgi:hypothetical protein